MSSNDPDVLDATECAMGRARPLEIQDDLR
jgi:hypothetical protein